MEFKHRTSGVRVSVDEETAQRLGVDWEPLDGAPDGDDTPSKSWKVDRLKAYAEEHGIDLGTAKTKQEILDALASAADDHDDSDDDTGE